MEKSSPRRLLTEIFEDALKSVNPYNAVRPYGDRIISAFKKYECEEIVVAGFGKAACPMAKAVEDGLAQLICRGVAITKDGHCAPPGRPEKMEIIEAGHPIPDERGVKGSKTIMSLLGDCGEKTLVICLISGGGSALLVAPRNGISLSEKQKVTRLLLRAGADIDDLNTARKHLSMVKGGRLAEIAFPAPLISLIISDVIGDRLDVIASGPTAPDMSTYGDALRVLEKYRLVGEAPRSVLDTLTAGSKGLLPETPKGDDQIFERCENLIIASNRKALHAAREKASSLGLDAEIISAEVRGEARKVGRHLAEEVSRIRKGKTDVAPLCLISGGETTVTVEGSGLGGRNMELALSFAMAVDGIHGITLLSAGTDGTDGPTDAAGALVDGSTAKMAREIGLDPERSLRNNDSYNFHKDAGTLFVSGPTGTNVMDIQIIIVE